MAWQQNRTMEQASSSAFLALLNVGQIIRGSIMPGKVWVNQNNRSPHNKIRTHFLSSLCRGVIQLSSENITSCFINVKQMLCWMHHNTCTPLIKSKIYACRLQFLCQEYCHLSFRQVSLKYFMEKTVADSGPLKWRSSTKAQCLTVPPLCNCS